MPVLAINTEVGRIVEVVERILQRRETREREFGADLEDDLEAIGLIVTQMNRVYVDLLEDIQWDAIGAEGAVEGPDQVLEQIHAFLHADDLVATLIDLRGRIRVASQSRGLRGRKHRDVVTALRGLERAVSSYLEHIAQLQNDEQQVDSEGTPLWNLSTVQKLIRDGENESELPLRELCEEAIRNRRIDLVHEIADLVGQSRQHVRQRKL